ncbi:unannotated protein [freshwater metagenome]|uniref:Unannotated protein n=1 Tax=freshwater metagenome TaxID=449393 RepID=A0A6J6W982_9ZZZZ
MHDDCAVIISWLTALRFVNDVKKNLKTKVSIDVNMYLPFGIPICVKNEF